MEQEEKVRRFIKIDEKDEVVFEQVREVIEFIVNDVLKDELVAHVYIDEEGMILGISENRTDDLFVYNDGTLMRFYTRNKHWRISVIRRRSKKVTLIEFVSPRTTMDGMDEAIELVLSKVDGVEITMGDSSG